MQREQLDALKAQGVERELRLHRGPETIAQLIEQARPGFCDCDINDERFPAVSQTQQAGEELVRSCTFRGREFQRADGRIYDMDLGRVFKELGVRFPDLAEALAVLAADDSIGRERPCAAFIRNSSYALKVDQGGDERRFELGPLNFLRGDYDVIGVYDP